MRQNNHRCLASVVILLLYDSKTDGFYEVGAMIGVR